MISAVLERAGDWLAVGLVHGTALAIVTALALATVLRRARPALVAVLWTVVLLKFLVPIGPRAHLSLSSALEHLLPAGGAPAASTGAVQTSVAPVAAAPAAAVAGSGAWSALAAGLALLYMGGLAVAVLRLVRAQRALRRRLAHLPVADLEIASALERAAAILRLGAAPLARIDRDASGPYLVGTLRPVLVLPAWLGPSSPAWWSAVLHELAHVKRRDPLLALVAAVAACLFWFWPPVAFARRRLDRAREMACDEWALARGPLGALDYARFLVEVATRRGGHAHAGLALLRSRSQLAARVDHLVDGARAPALGRGRAALLAGWAVLALAGAGGVARAEPDLTLQCSIEPDLIAQILASHPDADTDRDGVLSQDEACAHQRRMRQRLLDQVVDAEMVSQLDPAADLDGDGVLSGYEIDWAKNQIDVGLADPDGELVLEYAGERAVPVDTGEVRVAAAPQLGRVCRAATGCGQVAPSGRFPLLIDVSNPQE